LIGGLGSSDGASSVRDIVSVVLENEIDGHLN
jgi:hypothetical protein